jgi:glyoxylase-like metal-dependent hydrolase (beta-lactamase superfamily II)
MVATLLVRSSEPGSREREVSSSEDRGSTMGWPFGGYPEGGLQRLGPHVTAYYGEVLPVSNSAIVRGSDATLVFDANAGAAAAALRAEVDRAGPPLRYLVLSHVHTDHTLGAMWFSPPAPR